MQTLKAGGVEEREPRPGRFDVSTDPFERDERLLPRPGDTDRVLWHEHQLGAARERLPEPHPHLHTLRLRGRGDIPDLLGGAGRCDRRETREC